MRVLVLTNLYPNPMQPHRAAFNRQQFAALARQHEVRVIAPIAWTGALRAIRIGSRKAGRKVQTAESRSRVCDGMIVQHPRYFYTPKMLRGLYGRFFLESVRACVHAAAREFRPDVLLACWAYPDGWAAVELGRELGLPVAIKIHGSDVLLVDDHPGRRRRTADALASADAVIAVSRHLGKSAVALGAAPDRMHVVSSGVDATLFHPGPQDAARQNLGITSTSPLILFAGNLVPVKGLDVLVESLASVLSTGQEFQCVLVGAGPLRAELQTRIDVLGLTDRVRMIGARPLSELAVWYQAADLFVLPSRSEGLPNVLLEAAACGTPFIASDVGGIHEIARAESLVPPGDPALLANRICSALKAGRAGCPASGPRPGSWDDSARELADVLQRIIADAPARSVLAA